jgi:hypothetical protein
VILTEIIQHFDTILILKEFYTWKNKNKNGKVLIDLIVQILEVILIQLILNISIKPNMRNQLI